MTERTWRTSEHRRHIRHAQKRRKRTDCTVWTFLRGDCEQEGGAKAAGYHSRRPRGGRREWWRTGRRGRCWWSWRRSSWRPFWGATPTGLHRPAIHTSEAPLVFCSEGGGKVVEGSGVVVVEVGQWCSAHRSSPVGFGCCAHCVSARMFLSSAHQTRRRRDPPPHVAEHCK
uniref:Uncharacterized protein n=1 Tax=Plectus sambesii TaxID=2011161 RepID=A0A914WUX6_9BILA